ncbi:Phototropin-2 [Dactylella cylindrospora]|nr:Phototropin-2 [Dactylella cylindrospora]
MGNSNGKPVVFTDEVNLNHFRLLRVVGKGAFGKVRIVERKDTGLTFALKYIRKDEVVRSESVRNIIRERRMLEHLNHPFICNLRYSFQDVEYLYIVVDLMNGGDLRFHINRKTFTEDAVRFWIAEIACALVYTHKRMIVHRDVKPDNILLDSDGHVHLADFNVASDIHPDRPLTSKSGTLAYLAPEVYSGKGYGTAVDWWSLGVVFYECIYGKRPFVSDSHEELAKEIMRASPHYHVTNPPVSTACMSAIKGLLNPDPRFRLGAAGFETFTSHPFFQSIDFDALMRKEIDPVFVPSRDKTNFDATYDLEELLLEEAPLEARARRQKPREQLKEDATPQEVRTEELHRMIETLFEPFDYTVAQYDKYPGTIDPVTKSVGPVPEWVKPASEDHSGPVAIGAATTTNNTQTDKSRVVSPSPSGSPPIPTTVHAKDEPSRPPTSSSMHDLQRTHTSQTVPPVPPVPGQVVTSQHGGTKGQNGRTQSSTGGVQVVLNPTGSWSGINNQEAMQSAALSRDGKKPSGMLGFLSKRKGRGASPKPQERGVLGREGARQIIN